MKTDGEAWKKDLSNISETLKRILQKKKINFSDLGSDLPQESVTKIKDFILTIDQRLVEQDERIRLLERSLAISSKEIRQYILSLEQANAAAIQSSKMAAIGEMSANISHEINNPLQIISGNAEMLELYLDSQAGLTNKEKAVQYIRSIQLTVRRITQIIRSLKRLSRTPVSMEYSYENIYRLMEDCLAIGQESIRKNHIQLKFKCEQNLLAEVPSLELSQVFLNLYTNAKQAVNDLKDEKERWIEVVVQLKTNPNILQIVFSNGGPPIPKEHQEKIFETFFTTKNINKGTGLGLSVSRKIISDMGGQLYLNKECAHPEFIIEFPQKKISPL